MSMNSWDLSLSSAALCTSMVELEMHRSHW